VLARPGKSAPAAIPGGALCASDPVDQQAAITLRDGGRLRGRLGGLAEHLAEVRDELLAAAFISGAEVRREISRRDVENPGAAPSPA